MHELAVFAGASILQIFNLLLPGNPLEGWPNARAAARAIAVSRGPGLLLNAGNIALPALNRARAN